MMSRPLVSVCVISYNHEKYIEQCLHSIVEQKSFGSFDIEIIISDDCSLDETKNIIEGFDFGSAKVSILNNERNMGMQGNFFQVINLAKGDYIAICEGDDYWVDPRKLQKQFLAMEKRKDINLCFTNAYHESQNGVRNLGSRVKNEHIYSFDNVVIGGGGFCTTATLFLRRNVISNLPPWFADAPVGDYYLQVISAYNKGAIYLPDITASYRCMSSGSWSERRREKKEKELFSEINKNLHAINQLSLTFGIQYRNAFEIAAAKELYLVSLQFLLNGYPNQYRVLIERSFSIKKGISRLQVFLYFFRRAPRMAKLIFNFIK
ncbi:MAG: glycosyltransferase [Pseudomonadota bacterium]|nr:glycosyltransferase [Pseudomonadota bacterium]